MHLWVGLLLWIGALCAASYGQTTLQGTINMAGVKGRAEVTLTNTQEVSVTVTLTMGQSCFTQRPVTFEIRSSWVYYDRVDKCNDQSLGPVVPLMTQTLPSGFSASGSTSASVTLRRASDIGLVEGLSLRMTSSDKTVCVTLERDEPYFTAVATFRGPLIFGTIHFRQSRESSTRPTRILSSLQNNNALPASQWKIVTDLSRCNSAFSSDNTFNPSSVDNSQCSGDDLTKCAVGALTDKFGNLNLGGSDSSISTSSFFDSNLPLSGTHTVGNKAVAIEVANGPTACAEIKMYSTRNAVVHFSESGVTGNLTFQQHSPIDYTQIVVHLSGLNGQAGGYHVHKWPRPVKTMKNQAVCSNQYVAAHWNPYGIDLNNNYPAPTVSTVDMYEVGDLSSKFGTLQGLTMKSEVLHDQNLPLFGKNSIIGRSLVIHRNDTTASRWVCSNIEPQGDVVAAVATFKTPVIGQIIFVQDANMPSTDTSIVALLDYLDDSLTSTNDWHINTNMIQNDLMSSMPQRCQSTLPIYNPSGLYSDATETVYSSKCTMSNPLHCKMGDLSGRHGKISIKTSAPGTDNDNYAENFFTDSNLPLSGPESIIGKSVVVMDTVGSNILACADIVPLHGPKLQASFSSGDIQGTVTLSQIPGYGARETKVINNLGGSINNRLSVYTLPPPITDDSCSELGDVYNPLGATAPPTGGTESEYPVGDLRMFGMDKRWSLLNLPLTGLTSIMGRSLVVLNAGGQVVACSQLLPPPSVGLPQLAVINITAGGVQGAAHMYQMLYSDGSLSETSIVLNFRNTNAAQTPNHNWHVHMAPVGNDATAATDRCMSTQGHFDPYNAIENKAIYDRFCNKVMPLHCEVGDQANKLGTYNIGGGRSAFNDIDLPLAGKYSVLGRSMVFHIENRGAGRLACADIIPASAEPVLVEFVTPSTLDKRAAAQIYANAADVKAPVENVVVQIVSQSGGKTRAHVHFTGLQREVYRARFVQFISIEANRESLGDYAPLSGPGKAGSIAQTPMLLVVFLAVSQLMKL